MTKQIKCTRINVNLEKIVDDEGLETVNWYSTMEGLDLITLMTGCITQPDN